MTGFFLVFALTLGIGGILYSVFDDDETDDAAQDPDPDMPPVDPDDPAGQVLLYDGSEVLEGTAGNDILLADDPDHVEPEAILIKLGAGDDFAEIGGISDQEPQVLRGDDGDDVLRILDAAPQAEARGGDGDDRVTVRSGSAGFGGTGDDIVEVILNNRSGDNPSSARGGPGDDTLAAVLEDYTAFPNGTASLVGGTGSDTFDIVLRPFETPDTTVPEPGSVTNLGGIGTIEDFDPAEDQIRLITESPSRVINRIDFSPTTTLQGSPATDVTIEFDDGNPVRTYQVAFRVVGADDLGSGDIEIVSRRVA